MSRSAASISLVRVLALCIAISPLLGGSCIARQLEQEVGANGHADNGVVGTANEVLGALEHKDGKLLASLVHPDKGVRFSPSAYVDLEADRIFYRAGVEGFWSDSSPYVWGYADGTGDPITMTPSEYSERYILTRDFRQTASVSINDDQAHGNTVNNAATMYPGATRVEYYIQASMEGPEAHFDWTALRLVFEQIDGAWLLVGVIHDQWSV